MCIGLATDDPDATLGPCDPNRKIAALLESHRDDIRSEHPTRSFACAPVVPDHALVDASVLVEAKYVRRGAPPSRATDGIAADLTKYPEEAFVVFVVYDPDRAIVSDNQFRGGIEAKGRNRVLIVR